MPAYRSVHCASFFVDVLSAWLLPRGVSSFSPRFPHHIREQHSHLFAFAFQRRARLQDLVCRRGV